MLASTKFCREEIKWRKWVDEKFVHVISPNVYRTPKESLQAFNWFSEWGNWKSVFAGERVVVYVGAAAMYLIGRQLKKRHGLKEDVRQSLYDECRHMLRYLKQTKSPFLGGARPNLADLSLYGILTAMQGCDAFKDARSNTGIGDWYDRMDEKVKSHAGAQLMLVTR
jgi:microsomal prostaglandin-E synthase 2